jgi:hypothetical protein
LLPTLVTLPTLPVLFVPLLQLLSELDELIEILFKFEFGLRDRKVFPETRSEFVEDDTGCKLCKSKFLICPITGEVFMTSDGCP